MSLLRICLMLVFLGATCFAQSNALPADAGRTATSVAAQAGGSGQQMSDPAPAGAEYRIGVEDDLQISVWREPELSMQVVVRPDGKITLPLLNDVQVVGLTTQDLQALLTEKLKPYVTEPQVTIIVRGIRSRKVYLVGQVSHPGAFPLNGQKTVLQMLAEAGGLNLFAKSESIYVLRKNGSRQEKIPFKYKQALKGQSDKSDFELVPGDVIVVP